MGLVTAVGQGPISTVGIAPIGGGGLKSILIDIGLTVAETVITNYLAKSNSGKTSDNKKIAGKVIRKTFRYARKRSRSRYRSNTFSSDKRFRGRRSKPRWRY